MNVISFRRKIFAGVTKLRISRSDYPGCGVVLNPMTNVLIRKKQREVSETQTYRGAGHMKTRQRQDSATLSQRTPGATETG